MGINHKIHLAVVISLIIGIIISTIPFGESFRLIKPPLVLLILIYWSLAFPENINLGYAFIFGMVLDTVLMMPLGYNSLCFAITLYLTIRLYPQIRHHSYINKMISIFFLLMPYYIISLWINALLKMNINIMNTVSSMIIAVIVWPLVFYILRFFRQRYLI